MVWVALMLLSSVVPCKLAVWLRQCATPVDSSIMRPCRLLDTAPLRARPDGSYY